MSDGSAGFLRSTCLGEGFRHSVWGLAPLERENHGFLLPLFCHHPWKPTRDWQIERSRQSPDEVESKSGIHDNIKYRRSKRGIQILTFLFFFFFGQEAFVSMKMEFSSDQLETLRANFHLLEAKYSTAFMTLKLTNLGEEHQVVWIRGNLINVLLINFYKSYF